MVCPVVTNGTTYLCAKAEATGPSYLRGIEESLRLMAAGQLRPLPVQPVASDRPATYDDVATDPLVVARRKAAKPRIPLGQPQRCRGCGDQTSSSRLSGSTE